jgi:hypothetical protein
MIANRIIVQLLSRPISRLIARSQVSRRARGYPKSANKTTLSLSLSLCRRAALLATRPIREIVKGRAVDLGKESGVLIRKLLQGRAEPESKRRRGARSRARTAGGGPRRRERK